MAVIKTLDWAKNPQTIVHFRIQPWIERERKGKVTGGGNQKIGRRKKGDRKGWRERKSRQKSKRGWKCYSLLPLPLP